MATKFVLVLMTFILFLAPATSIPVPTSIWRGLRALTRNKYVRKLAKDAIKDFIKNKTENYMKDPVYYNFTSNKPLGGVNHQQSEGIVAAYHFDIEIGDPPVSYSGIMDTVGSLIWTQCKPCAGACFPQADPIFDPSESKTFSVLPCDSSFCPPASESDCSNECNYTYIYNNEFFTHGVLANETFTITETPFPDIVFGCGNLNECNYDNASGVIGFGRDKCLQPNGNGGVLLDSKSFITYLQKEGYKKVKQALLSNVTLPVADTSVAGPFLCFSSSDPSQVPPFPPMTLHFDGGADMVLQQNDYMWIDETDGLLCLTMLPSDEISVLGNLQLTNKHIFFDLKNRMFSFQTADCSAFIS
ncbi:aspartic proteinase nepenthesin-1-like [Typha latifolia]|uniref:aspartic proteinase nepenthesin-1-like n=1 Tax=Typha latifolia TaxID=4733 RepID=UPI003C2C311C